MKTVTSPSYSSLSFISQLYSAFPSYYYTPSYSSSSLTSSPYTSIVAKTKKNHHDSKVSESPRRITSNVKQNLQFLKLWKEFQKRKSGIARPSTSYRKKKVEKEDVPEDTDLYRDPTLNLYYTNQGIDNAIPVLLVDGYNVCGYWMKLKKHFMKGRLDIARQKLIDELVTFSTLREVKVVVVFDAMLSGLPSHKENFAGRLYQSNATAVTIHSDLKDEVYLNFGRPLHVTNFTKQYNFMALHSVDVVFSAETCADTWIETEVAALKEDGCPKVWVVSSDHCHQQAAHGAGAYVWSCKALVTEINASQKEVEMMLKETRSTSFQGRLLKHNLDAEVVDALKDLREKLSQNQT